MYPSHVLIQAQGRSGGLDAAELDAASAVVIAGTFGGGCHVHSPSRPLRPRPRDRTIWAKQPPIPHPLQRKTALGSVVRWNGSRMRRCCRGTAALSTILGF